MRFGAYRHMAAAGLAALTFLAAPPLRAAPPSYVAPPETAALRPGSGRDVTQANCTACHSADYVETQPRGTGFGRDFWQAEVTKMKKAYGAQISDEDAKIIVDYLASAYK